MLHVLLSLLAASPIVAEFIRRNAGCGNLNEICCSIYFLSFNVDYVEQFGNFTDSDYAPNSHRGGEWCWEPDEGCLEGRCVEYKDFNCGEIGEKCCLDGELK